MVKRLFPIPLMIVLVCSLILAGCAKPAPSPTVAEPIEIGVMYPLTGPMAMIGEWLVIGAMFGFEEAGYEVAGRKIEVILEDSAGQPNLALDKAKKLVEYDKVCMIIGPLTTSAKMALGSYMSKMGVPHIATQQSPLGMTEYEWSFMVGGATPQLCSPMGLYAYDEMGLRTVIVIACDTIEAHGFVDAFMEAFEKRGGRVIQEQYPPFPCMDYAPYLAVLEAADAVVAWFKGADAVLFLTQYHEFGIRERMPLVAAFHGAFFEPCVLHELSPEVADAMIGEYTPETWTPLFETDVNKRFVESFKKAKGRTPWDAEESSYLGAQVALRALKATGGDTTPERLRQAIMALDFQAPEGPFRFDPETRFTIQNVHVVKIDKIAEEYVLTPVYTYAEVPPSGL